MFAALREKLRRSGPVGLGVVAAALLVIVAVLVWMGRESFGPSSASRHNAERVYICAETGKTFPYSGSPAGKFPVMSPHSGKETGFPAQHCYWTADGKVKQEPTYVLMNVYQDKKGPTFCPECSRLVRADNPVVNQGSEPPPTREQYLKRRTARGRTAAAEEEDE